MLTAFAALSQLEREQLKQRQREGIAIAKAQGKYTGRKPVPTDWSKFGKLYEEWKAEKITARDFMRKMGLSANTFYRRVREYEIDIFDAHSSFSQIEQLKSVKYHNSNKKTSNYQFYYFYYIHLNISLFHLYQ